MTRSFLLTVFLFGVLFCAPHNALAADWLEPGVYTETDSKKSGEVHAFGNAERRRAAACSGPSPRMLPLFLLYALLIAQRL